MKNLEDFVHFALKWLVCFVIAFIKNFKILLYGNPMLILKIIICLLL